MKNMEKAHKVQIEELLHKGRPVQLPIEGYSMYPLLTPQRDRVIIVPFNGQKLRCGDVVLYRRRNGIMVLHRICRCGAEGIYLVGDNQTQIEGPILQNQVKGIMVGGIRNRREFSTSNFFYLVFTRLWLFLRPVRTPIKKIAKLAKKVF